MCLISNCVIMFESLLSIGFLRRMLDDCQFNPVYLWWRTLCHGSFKSLMIVLSLHICHGDLPEMFLVIVLNLCICREISGILLYENVSDICACIFVVQSCYTIFLPKLGDFYKRVFVMESTVNNILLFVCVFLVDSFMPFLFYLWWRALGRCFWNSLCTFSSSALYTDPWKTWTSLIYLRMIS